MHFMNPVPLMELVEADPGHRDSHDEPDFPISKARTYRGFRHTVLGKTMKAVAPRTFPAFIVNRILLPMINEAVYTLYEGVGTVESIDTAMRLGANHPMGPLSWLDFIGLDTCPLSVMQVLYDPVGLALDTLWSKYASAPVPAAW
jgi:3-hydroxybutyryl-CoA dehydrogenase